MADIKISGLAKKADLILTDLLAVSNTDGTLFKSDLQTFANLFSTVSGVGFKGALTISQATANDLADGFYFPSESGDYVLANSETKTVALTNNLVILIVGATHTTLDIIVSPVTVSVSTTFDETNNTIPASQKASFDKFNPLIEAEKISVALRFSEPITIFETRENAKLSSSGGFSSTNDFNVLKYPVTEGDIVSVIGQIQGVTSTDKLWGFYPATSFGGVISTSSDIGTTLRDINENITVPASANYLFLVKSDTLNISLVKKSEISQKLEKGGYTLTAKDLDDKLDVEITARQNLDVSLSAEILSTEVKISNNISNNINPFTSNEDINKLIKAFYFEGLDISEKYYIQRIRQVLSNGFYECLIFKEVAGGTDVEVCKYLSDSPFDDKYFEFLESNSSGVSGYGFIDLAVTDYDYNNLTEYLNINLITTRNSILINHFEQDYLIKDNTSRINKLNPLDVKELTEVNFSGNRLLIGGTSSDFFNITKLFPIPNGGTITISNVNFFQTSAWIVDKNRKILQRIDHSNVNSVSVTNNNGVDGYLISELRYDSVKNGEYPQFEYASTDSSYEGYLINTLVENKIEVILPKKMFFLKDDISNIYKKNILKANSLSNENHIELNGLNEVDSITYPRQINIEPKSNKTQSVSVRSLNNRMCTSKISTDFEFITALTSGTISVLPLGDSFTDIGKWVNAWYEKATDEGLTLNNIGLKRSLASKFSENQTGGTLQNSFLDSRGSAFILRGVTGNTNLLQDLMKDGGSPDEYQDSNSNNYFFDGRKIDSSGNGLVRVIPNGHSNTPPSNSTLTKVASSTNVNNVPTIVYTTVETINRNPFLDPSNNSISVQYYLQKYGFESEFDLTNSSKKFVIPLQFSWNDNARFYDIETLNDNITSFKALIDVIHTEYPHAYIIIGIEPMASNLGSRVYNTLLGVQVGRLEFAKLIFKNFEDNSAYNDFCFVNAGYAFVDIDNSFVTDDMVLSPRLPNLITKKAKDGLHCNDAGMFQLGDSYYPILQKILSL